MSFITKRCFINCIFIKYCMILKHKLNLLFSPADNHEAGKFINFSNDSFFIHSLKILGSTDHILAKNNRTELSEHVITHRPWGYFENISSNKNHKIKKLTVMPGKKLSLQSHSKRSEHWVVIKGKATIILNNKKFTLNENESTYIPKKEGSNAF